MTKINPMNHKPVKLLLRLSIALGFLSAVADRFGFWGPENSTWGTWETFLDYTHLINPWFPDAMIPALGAVATVAEILLALFLILGFKTELVATLSGILLLLFALSMTLSTGLKGPLDYSVFTDAAAAFDLGSMKDKYLELDVLFSRKEIGPGTGPQRK